MIQFKVLDIVKPLLLLFKKYSDDLDHPTRKFAEASIRLWSEVFSFITETRRQNILASTFPNLKSS